MVARGAADYPNGSVYVLLGAGLYWGVWGACRDIIVRYRSAVQLCIFVQYSTAYRSINAGKMLEEVSLRDDVPAPGVVQECDDGRTSNEFGFRDSL